MDDQMIRAKELFTSYDGSTFQMYRDGLFEEYKQYNIPKQLEISWINEMIDQSIQELSITNWKALFRLDSIATNHQDERILKSVLSFASRNVMSSDSIVKLMYAERIIEIIQKTNKQINKELRLEAYKTSFIILEDILKKPLIIDPGHELENFNIKDKKSLNDRANKSIERIKNDLN
ncbi:hypothetical protein [Cohnella terricola]|uniref:Uncharacterized protein n=1 Tax=Cohnella terricola TaxID=1289167 RepID=A0A559J8X1_9BACL|nr:hypothetical protein [Cohnella terricola]TVX96286.1 hypothetical protein FPZ45_21510 [Cohnella terricola]